MAPLAPPPWIPQLILLVIHPVKVIPYVVIVCINIA